MSNEIGQSAIQRLEDVIDSKIKKAQKLTSSTEIAQVINKDNDGTVWVHILGGADQTPVTSVGQVVENGDYVQVLIDNGRAIIPGNVSNPSNVAGLQNGVNQAISYTNTLVSDTVKAQTGIFEHLEAEDAYIKHLVADEAVIQDLTAENATIASLIADRAQIADLVAGNASIYSLNALKADIDAANITSLTAQQSWLDKVMVQTGMLAQEGTIFYLDAIKINAVNITAGTLDVDRLVATSTSCTLIRQPKRPLTSR